MLNYRDIIDLVNSIGIEAVEGALLSGQVSRETLNKVIWCEGPEAEQIEALLKETLGVKVERPKRFLKPAPNTPGMKNPPLCKCGCGTPVEESRKAPGTWNRYYSRHGVPRNKEQFKTPPLCKCGCGQMVSWSYSQGGRWHAYADHFPLITEVGPYYTKQQLCKVLTTFESAVQGNKTGVSIRTIERRVKQGLLPKPVWCRVDGKSPLHAVFLATDIEPILQRRMGPPTGEIPTTPHQGESKEAVEKYLDEVTLQDIEEQTGVCSRTVQRWVSRGRFPKPNRLYGKGAGRGGPATWNVTVLKVARELAAIEKVIEDLRNPIKAPGLMAKLLENQNGDHHGAV